MMASSGRDTLEGSGEEDQVHSTQPITVDDHYDEAENANGPTLLGD